MLEAKKHLNNIEVYPIEEEFDWDLKLDFNENLVGPSPKVLKAIKNLSKEKIQYYPAYNKLLEAIAKYNQVDKSNIVPVNGADEGFRYIFDAYCSFGDNVLTVTPAFTMPKVYAQIANCNYIEIPFKTRWQFPIEEFLEAINPSIKMIILTSPNSPTGSLIDTDDLQKIIEKAKDSLVIIDETYANFADTTYTHYPEKYKNVLIIKSMSKDFATAGLRLGYIISSNEIINNIKKIISPFSVNSIAALAGVEALSDEKHLKKVKAEIQKSKQYLMKELKPFAKEIYNSDTNFLCVDFGENAQYIYKKLIDNKIKIKLLSGLAQNCARITIPQISGAKKLIRALKKRKPLIVFDMDGVLVDASKSYRIAIQETFKFFTKKEVSLEKIQKIKNQGGYNNDWLLTQKLLNDENIKIPYEKIIEKFNEFYFGKNNDGLFTNEKWLISKDNLEKLSEKYELAIFTGRTKHEALVALQTAEVEHLFAPIITMDELNEDEQKPSPKGLEIIKSITNAKKIYYLGDTIDDMKAGTSAKVKAIGVLPPQDKSEKLNNILKSNGAIAVLNDINDLLNFLEKKL